MSGYKRSIIEISESDFIQIARIERCRAYLDEYRHAIKPLFHKYICGALDFINDRTYPTWRINKEKTKCIGAYEIPREKADPASFIEFSKYQHLFHELSFDPCKNYFLTNNIVVFHCVRCAIHVVKDGSHRLLECAYHGKNPSLNVYEVYSEDWSNAKVDMKNFCDCIANQI